MSKPIYLGIPFLCYFSLVLVVQHFPSILTCVQPMYLCRLIILCTFSGNVETHIYLHVRMLYIIESVDHFSWKVCVAYFNSFGIIPLLWKSCICILFSPFLKFLPCCALTFCIFSLSSNTLNCHVEYSCTHLCLPKIMLNFWNGYFTITQIQFAFICTG